MRRSNAFIEGGRFLLQAFSVMFVFKEKKSTEKFGSLYKKPYLCIAFKKQGRLAQLV
jgi:hypothetical protein